MHKVAVMVMVPVLKAFRYEGRQYQKGGTVAMSPLDAARHARQGHVSLARVTTRQLEAEPIGDDAKPKRRYRRRDMTAEDTS